MDSGTKPKNSTRFLQPLNTPGAGTGTEKGMRQAQSCQEWHLGRGAFTHPLKMTRLVSYVRERQASLGDGIPLASVLRYGRALCGNQFLPILQTLKCDCHSMSASIW